MEDVSVCMASYNGEAYIGAQVLSILSQLGSNDELIIVDDCSTDKTIELVGKINDRRIRLIENRKNAGVCKAFEKSLSVARNDYIFLSDQDDIWIPGRLSLMLGMLKSSGKYLLSSGQNLINAEGTAIDAVMDALKEDDSTRHIKNILGIIMGKMEYYGCAMVMKRELLPIILPMPSFVESHDLWIAIAANMLKSNMHTNVKTLDRRIHGKNASVVNRSLAKKLISRFVFFLSMLVIAWRIARNHI